MSFHNTHTPTLAEIEGKARYQVPMHKGRRGAMTYYLTPELEQHFRKLYPVTMNRDMMRIFGVSFVTLQRLKRQLGLQKKMRTIRHKQAQLAKRICEENGYYDSLRGKQVSDACKEAIHQLRASGFHPMKALKEKNPRKYRRILEQRSEARKELMHKERIRVDWGLTKQTNLHIPYDPYGRKRLTFRNTCKRTGYIPGNAYEPAERWIIYYTPDTIRGAIREQHGTALGFKFEPINN
jgi:hypothetical protein